MLFNSLFTGSQTETLRALVNCIIPADDFPGGWDAGVGDYLARLMTREPQFLLTYRAGLDALDADAPGFSALPPDAQEAFLKDLEQDAAQGAFFRMLVTHTLEGFYADPGNSGNRDGVAWQMIGYTVTA